MTGDFSLTDEYPAYISWAINPIDGAPSQIAWLTIETDTEMTSPKVAVITGGASGIGFATGRGLAERGWNIVVADVEDDRLAAAVRELASISQAIGVRTDVRDYAAVQALAQGAYAHFGDVDMVFNNAGVATSGPIAEMTHDDWKWVMDVDLWGPIHGVEAFLPRMLEAGGTGHLLFTSSFGGLVPNMGLGPYTVAKYGVVALAEVLHRELRETGIGVSVLCPMRVATDIGSSHRNRPAELGGPDSRRPPPPQERDLRGDVLDVDTVARQVIDAIGTSRLYILPHEESRQMIERRFARISRAFQH